MIKTYTKCPTVRVLISGVWEQIVSSRQNIFVFSPFLGIKNLNNEFLSRVFS